MGARMNKITVMIIGMALVTYVPRAVPAVFIKYIRWNNRSEQFLKLIPYTAMGALIFPGILSVDVSTPQIGVIGGITALILGFCKVNTMIVLIASVAAVMVTYYFFM